MRIPALVLVAALLGGAAAAQEPAGTLGKIRETGRIVLGLRDAAPPFSYLDEERKIIVGYSVDICGKIVDALRAELNLPGLRTETVTVNSSTRIPLVVSGTVDLECGSTTNTAERQRLVAFSNSHFVTASRFVSKKADRLERIDDLKGRIVVSVSGSINVAQLNKANRERRLGLNVVAVRDAVEAFALVESGGAAAFVMDDIQLVTLVAAAKEPSAYAISQEAFGPPEPYGIMLRKGDAPFKAAVDRATAGLYKSGDIVAIYNKWFESPVPPRGVNYRYPMPKVVQRAFDRPSDSADPRDYAD